jgi:phage protein D
MVEHQGPRRHAMVQIIVHGMQDVTDRLHPYLISVQVIDNLEGGMDECHIELDDRNAELQIPPDGAELQVAMGWAGEGPRLFDSGRGTMGFQNLPQNFLEMTAQQKQQEAKFGGPGMVLVFDGWVTKTESGFGRRGGGRRLWIDAEGANSKGKVKETQQDSMGEGTEDDSAGGGGKGKIPLKDMMTKVFGAAGLSVAMSPEMEKITRDYWHINDSPMNFGKRMAQEVGGLFKISKSTAVLIAKTEGVNAAGEKMPTVDAIWGINLIGWRIKPYVGRPQYGEAASRMFDVHKGEWQTIKGAISGGTPFGGTEAVANAVNSVADKTTGEQTNKGTGADSETRRGEGWVLINGEPNAKANGFVRIDGARPGVDGTYTMTEVEHNYTRGVGYTTRANVRSPMGTGAGMEWVQDGDTEAEKKKRDEEYAKSKEEEGESWSPDPAEEESARYAREHPPTPPISGDQTYTAEELERIRRAQEPAPPISGPNEPPPPSPPISGEQTFTSEELEAIRRANEGYQSGQGGEGGIAFPQ